MSPEQLTVFSERTVPIPDMEKFYYIEPSALSGDMPYVWVMFVQSADGIVSFLDFKHPNSSIGRSGPGIALADIRDTRPEAVGAYVDWRVLEYGWTVADAIVAGSGILDAEPSLTWMPVDKDLLVEYDRLHVNNVPYRVLVTGRGFTAKQMSECAVFNHTDGKFRTLVATTDSGLLSIQKEKEKMNKVPTADFVSFGVDSVDFRELMKFLRTKGVKTVDCQGGPQIAGQFFEAGIVNEYRATIAPAIAGNRNVDGLVRPNAVNSKRFGPGKLPTMRIMNIGKFGEHLFLRYSIANNGLV